MIIIKQNWPNNKNFRTEAVELYIIISWEQELKTENRKRYKRDRKRGGSCFIINFVLLCLLSNLSLKIGWLQNLDYTNTFRQLEEACVAIDVPFMVSASFFMSSQYSVIILLHYSQITSFLLSRHNLTCAQCGSLSQPSLYASQALGLLPQ